VDDPLGKPHFRQAEQLPCDEDLGAPLPKGAEDWLADGGGCHGTCPLPQTSAVVDLRQRQSHDAVGVGAGRSDPVLDPGRRGLAVRGQLPHPGGPLFRLALNSGHSFSWALWQRTLRLGTRSVALAQTERPTATE